MTDGSTESDTRERTVLITGATAGIGYETARVLAKRGGQVLITGRDTNRGERAAAAIRRESSSEQVRFLQADHSTVGGNEALATRVSEVLPGPDVLVNNVVGSYATRWETADGYEATLAMNLVGPFALTSELLPLLHTNAPARVINVARRRSRCGSATRSRTCSPGSSSSAQRRTRGLRPRARESAMYGSQ